MDRAFRREAVSAAALLLSEAGNPVPFAGLMGLRRRFHNEVDMPFRRHPCRDRISRGDGIMNGDMLP